MSGEKLLPGRQLFCSFDFNQGSGKISQLRRMLSRLYYQATKLRRAKKEIHFGKKSFRERIYLLFDENK